VSAQLLIPWFRYYPFAVEIGPTQFTLYPFRAMMWTGVVTSLVIAVLFAHEQGRSLRETVRFGAYILVFAFPVSKLFNALFYQPGTWDSLLENPASILDIPLGWSMYGGVLGGILGARVWKWRTHGSILEIGDSFAFAGPFGWCIGRVGCFMVHDHPGRVSDFALAVADFQVGKPPWPPRHDLGLYEAIVLAVISILFLILSRKPRKPGVYLGLVGLLYLPARFFLDFLRAPHLDGGDIRYAGLTPSQYVSIGLFIVGVFVVHRLRASSAEPI